MDVSEGACLKDSKKDPVKERLHIQEKEGIVFSVRFLRRLERMAK